jgi:hypothetical protein
MRIYNWVKLNKDVIYLLWMVIQRDIWFVCWWKSYNNRYREIKRYETCRFNSFPTYKSRPILWYMMRIFLSNNAEEWKEAICTCSSFMKNYTCKNIIGMSIRLKYCKLPHETKKKLYWYSIITYICFILLFFLSIVNKNNVVFLFFVAQIWN